MHTATELIKTLEQIGAFNVKVVEGCGCVHISVKPKIISLEPLRENKNPNILSLS